MGCIIDKDISGDYYDKEFPKIITKFTDLWEEEIDLLDGNVSPDDKESVREEIKLALCCSNKLPRFPGTVAETPTVAAQWPTTFDMELKSLQAFGAPPTA